MSAMDDFFGKYPQRPNHPDFWKLSSIVLSMDADSQDKSFDEIVDVDTASLVYMGEQRYNLGLSKLGLALEPSAIWIDGFEAGRRYERENGD